MPKVNFVKMYQMEFDDWYEQIEHLMMFLDPLCRSFDEEIAQLKKASMVREAAKKNPFFSGPTTQTGAGATTKEKGTFFLFVALEKKSS